MDDLVVRFVVEDEVGIERHHAMAQVLEVVVGDVAAERGVDDLDVDAGISLPQALLQQVRPGMVVGRHLGAERRRGAQARDPDGVRGLLAGELVAAEAERVDLDVDPPAADLRIPAAAR